jgi:hypothetical protein
VEEIRVQPPDTVEERNESMQLREKDIFKNVAILECKHTASIVFDKDVGARIRTPCERTGKNRAKDTEKNKNTGSRMGKNLNLQYENVQKQQEKHSFRSGEQTHSGEQPLRM